SLVNFGYRVLAANDGEQAVRLCEEETPSLAVLDVVMPHLGGPATAAQLLARFPACRSSSPVVIRNIPALRSRRRPLHDTCRSLTARPPWAEPFAISSAIRKRK